MEKETGIIYLIQPAELVGTQRFKIGCSSKNRLDRVKSYRKGTRYLHISECENPLKLEKIIKESFNKKFILIAGREYFEGDEQEMYKLFSEILCEYKNECNTSNDDIILDVAEEHSDDTESSSSSDPEEKDFVDEDILDKGINYKEDEECGGSKKIVWFDISKLGNNQYLIDINYIKENSNCNNEITYDTVNVDTGCDLEIYGQKYIDNLIKKKIIENGCIYDLNNKKFIKSLDKLKTKINDCILHSSLLKASSLYKSNKYNLIQRHFTNDTIINGYIYCDLHSEEDKMNKHIYVDILREHLFLHKFNNIWYSSEYLQNNLPYLIEINSDDNANAYFINRKYIYIELNTKTNPKKWSNVKRDYFYNDGNCPWLNKNNENKYKAKMATIKSRNYHILNNFLDV